MTAGMLPGPYKVPAFRARGHFRLTNKTPAATYRAPGRYESTFVRERIMDAIADRLALDPIEVRRVNFIAKSEMPFERPIDTLGEKIVYDFGRLCGPAGQDAGGCRLGQVARELRHRRAEGEAVGAGFAMFVEKSGLGPADSARVDRRYHRRGRTRHRRRVDGAGLRDGHGADLRRRTWRRLQDHQSHSRANRSDCSRHRRAFVARDGDDRFGRHMSRRKRSERRRSGSPAS